MNALDAAREHYLSRFEAFERGIGSAGPAWLRALRRQALEHFAELGLPSTRREEWRYTNLTPLAKIPFELPSGSPESVSRDAVEARSIPVLACSSFVFVDGRYSAELSVPRVLSGSVRVESLARVSAEAPDAIEPHLGRYANCKEHPFAALNTAFLDDGAALLIPPGTRVENPLHVVFLSTDGGGTSVRHPRVLIVAGAGSRVVVIQDHVSLGEAPGFTNVVTEVHAGRDAEVDLSIVQRENASTFHVSGLHLRQERDSRFAAHTITLGGSLVRNDVVALLGDEGASCQLDGLFVGGRSQVLDSHTLIDHAMPHGTSRELYKGILGGRAKGVFRGRVIVRPDAQGTNAYQSNPNLLLNDGAEIDTKPQLEIHADDVKCSHGSSIGQLDQEALFYLRTRGLAEAAARDLLTRGFASEILARLPVAALGEGLAELLDARLDDARRPETAP